jgi:transcriptional activator HAC1
VSVELAAEYAPAVSSTDTGFPYSLQPHTSFDEKPMDDLFNFNEFPEQSVEQSASLADSAALFTGSFFEDTASNPYGLSDTYDAKSFDLQTTSGATHVSDGVLAADI